MQASVQTEQLSHQSLTVKADTGSRSILSKFLLFKHTAMERVQRFRSQRRDSPNRLRDEERVPRTELELVRAAHGIQLEPGVEVTV